VTFGRRETFAPKMTDAPPSSSFAGLGLGAELLHAVEAEGYAEATPVQRAAIPAVLAGRDVVACAETGSGKTLAFGLPLLQRLIDAPRVPTRRGNVVAVLVLAPTRELVMQIGDVLGGFAEQTAARAKVLSVFGGVKINPQMMALRGGVDVLVATPGRLLELCRSNAVQLGAVRALVLDEADRMLGLGFEGELREILALLPGQRQSLLFSATFPAELNQLVSRLLDDPVRIDVAPVSAEPLIESHVYTVNRERKNALLIHLIKALDLRQVLVFVSAKRTGNGLGMKLAKRGIQAAVFHGDRSQLDRSRSLADFRSGKLRVLIATDLAARGIDVEDLPAVINFELPRSPDDYVHRIGRTGRAGKRGLALSLICPDEYAHFRVIERRMKQRLPREQVPGFEVDEAGS
jgi:ATP-dependent RNA helicase RhlE